MFCFIGQINFICANVRFMSVKVYLGKYVVKLTNMELYFLACYDL